MHIHVAIAIKFVTQNFQFIWNRLSRTSTSMSSNRHNNFLSLVSLKTQKSSIYNQQQCRNIISLATHLHGYFEILNSFTNNFRKFYIPMKAHITYLVNALHLRAKNIAYPILKNKIKNITRILTQCVPFNSQPIWWKMQQNVCTVPQNLVLYMAH